MGLPNTLEPILTALLLAKRTHPLRVGIDGFCASGKTTLADKLAVAIQAAGRRPIRVSADDFQNPPEFRWQLGSLSPAGFYKFQLNFEALRTLLLEPLEPGGSCEFYSSSYDVHSTEPNLSDKHTANASDILLLDGLFLHSPALKNCFDLTVFIHADFETCLKRALARNQEMVDSRAELESLYRDKYIPGFKLYMNEVNPEERASFVVYTD